MLTRRTKRISILLKKEIDEIIRLRLKDPRIQGLISIVAVDVSPDIKTAKVYVSIYGISKDDVNQSMDALKTATNYIKSHLMKRLRLKYIPNLEFILDDSLDRGDRIFQILNELSQK